MTPPEILPVIHGQHKPQIQHKGGKKYQYDNGCCLTFCPPQVGTGKKNTFPHIYHPISARKEASFSCLAESSCIAYFPRSHSPRIMPSFKYRIRLPRLADRISCVTITILWPFSLNLVSVSSTSSPVFELSAPVGSSANKIRSEERRVGKECYS